MDKVSYALGIGIGRQLASMGAESLNIDDFAQAVKDAIAGKLQLGEQEAQELRHQDRLSVIGIRSAGPVGPRGHLILMLVPQTSFWM